MALSLGIPLRSRVFCEGQGLAAGAVLAATMLRQLISPLVHDELPHIPYLAAVLIVSWRSGLVAGITATMLGAVAANWVFIGEYGRFSLETDDLWATAFFIFFGAAMAWLPAQLAAAIRREAELAARLKLVNGELQHRIKNIVAVIQSVVSQSARGSTSPEELRRKVEDRLHAMASALKLLNITEEDVPLRLLITEVLAPFRTEGTINLSGSDIRIPGDIAPQLALLLHELATNAVKYGALSVHGGAVKVGWECSGDLTRLSWVEEGGPRVQKPDRAGFGTRLIRAAVPNGEAHIEYRPNGVVCRVDVQSREQAT